MLRSCFVCLGLLAVVENPSKCGGGLLASEPADAGDAGWARPPRAHPVYRQADPRRIGKRIGNRAGGRAGRGTGRSLDGSRTRHARIGPCLPVGDGQRRAERLLDHLRRSHGGRRHEGAQGRRPAHGARHGRSSLGHRGGRHECLLDRRFRRRLDGRGDEGPCKRRSRDDARAATGARTHIAVDDTSVYWTEQMGGAVMRVPLGGGTPAVVANSTLPWNLAVDATSVYLMGNGVMKAAAGGGGPAITLVSSGSHPPQRRHRRGRDERVLGERTARRVVRAEQGSPTEGRRRS